MRLPAVSSEAGLAVVTGGSSGIGLATATALAKRGMRVVIVARDAERLASAAAVITQAAPGRCAGTCSADLSDLEDTKAAFERLVAEHGVPDVLVNSAGVVYPGEFTSMPIEHFDVNLTCGFWSVVNPCRAVAPLMEKRGSGQIINVSSGAGFLGMYGYTGYSAAKFAVVGFSEALRFEMRPAGVRVICVCPPDTETPALAFERTLRPPETEAMAASVKPIPAEKVAQAIVKSVGRDRFMVIPDAMTMFYFRLKRLLPGVIYLIVDGDIAKARKKRGSAGA